MAKLEGHFQLEKNENMDEYFSKVGKVSNEKKTIPFFYINTLWVGEPYPDKQELRRHQLQGL